MTTKATGADPQRASNVVPLPRARAPQPAPPLPKSLRRQPARRPTDAQRAWLVRGLDQAGGKLPLFNADGRRIGDRTIKSCIRQGWAEPWFDNPIKPDWLVCKLTEDGRRAIDGE